MGKNIGENLRKRWSGKYSQNFLAKHFATDSLKTSSKRVIQKQKQLVIWLVLQSLIKLYKFIYFKIHILLPHESRNLEI